MARLSQHWTGRRDQWAAVTCSNVRGSTKPGPDHFLGNTSRSDVLEPCRMTIYRLGSFGHLSPAWENTLTRAIAFICSERFNSLFSWSTSARWTFARMYICNLYIVKFWRCPKSSRRTLNSVNRPRLADFLPTHFP